MRTLALNMIIGPGDGDDLKRCLNSFMAKNTFDEIVLVPTTKDERVWEVAKEFTDKVYYFQWESEEYPYGNFAGARNLALDNTTSDYVMWLDCDDVCRKEHQKQLKTLREFITNEEHDPYVVSMPYHVLFKNSGDEVIPSCSFMKERIFKRVPELRWSYPVHEQLITDYELLRDKRKFIINNFAVSHASSKPMFASAERNIRTLRHEYEEKNNQDPHMQFFYGRDLMLAGEIEKGEKILAEFIDGMGASEVNIYAACFDIIMNAAFGKIESCPKLGQINPEKVNMVESYCRVAIQFAPQFAEAHVILGDIYLMRGHIKEAERLYKSALQRRLDSAGIVQVQEYYERVPAERLALIYSREKEFETALFYVHRALLHDKDDVTLIDMRTGIFFELHNKYFPKEG